MKLYQLLDKIWSFDEVNIRIEGDGYLVQDQAIKLINDWEDYRKYRKRKVAFIYNSHSGSEKPSMTITLKKERKLWMDLI